jgi:hypothetical protein
MTKYHDKSNKMNHSKEIIREFFLNFHNRLYHYIDREMDESMDGILWMGIEMDGWMDVSGWMDGWI